MGLRGDDERDNDARDEDEPDKQPLEEDDNIRGAHQLVGLAASAAGFKQRATTASGITSTCNGPWLSRHAEDSA